MRAAKLRIASLLGRTRLSGALLAGQARLLRPYLRAVNYHDVPASQAANFERQLGFYRRHFEPVGLPELRGFLQGRWPHDRPGLLLSFDDGLRSHAEVVAPLLEKHGFPGWFAVPAEFPELEIPDTAAFRRERQVRFDDADLGGRRPVLSWEDLRRLDAKHVVCCHSFSHRRLSRDLSDAERELEIREARRRLEAGLGHPVEVFVWVGGEEWSYSREAADLIRAAGFEIGLMTNSAPIRPGSDPFQLQRTHIEAGDPEHLVQLYLSGLYDLFYAGKRRRVNRLTAAT